MTDRTISEGTGIDAFERALETFGSDRTRWPAPVRKNFAGLLATSSDAQARLREAEALDRLLDLAPQPEIDTSALASRILAAAAKDAPATPSRPAARKPASVFKRPAARPSEAQWPAAALMAASLVLGAIFGLSGTFDQSIDQTIAEAALDNDIDPAQIALDSDSISMFEGDLL